MRVFIRHDFLPDRSIGLQVAECGSTRPTGWVRSRDRERAEKLMESAVGGQVEGTLGNVGPLAEEGQATIRGEMVLDEPEAPAGMGL